MLEALNALLAPAVMDRLTLVINHVLGSEGAAAGHLKPHRGRSIRLHLRRWPALLPTPPAFAFRVTPAGLVEWAPDVPSPADLELAIDASNPALLVADMLAGATPKVEIQGDAAFAGDVNWLIANLRWDAEADLERWFGAPAAHQIALVGGAFGRGLRVALQGASELAARLRPERA